MLLFFYLLVSDRIVVLFFLAGWFPEPQECLLAGSGVNYKHGDLDPCHGMHTNCFCLSSIHFPSFHNLSHYLAIYLEVGSTWFRTGASSLVTVIESRMDPGPEPANEIQS